MTPVPIGADRVTTDASDTVVSPYDGHALGAVPRCGRSEVDRAVREAADAPRSNPLSTADRAAILDRAAIALTAQRDRFARFIAEESAKPIRTARVEAERAVDTFSFAAAVARSRSGEVVPLDASTSGGGKLGIVVWVPIGVVGAITPFNFPLNLVAHKIAPAIAAGCTTVLKPAGGTPLTAIALADMLIDECGLPPGWLNVVTGPGSAVGAALVENDDVAMISFTGSPEVGWSIRAAAPRKRVNLELGNNSPVIIHCDGDWLAAAGKIAVAGFSHAGQSCISTQRIIAHEDIAEPFTEALVEKVQSLVVGDPLDEATDVSALITPGETQRVKRWIDEAVSAGAKLLTGGETDARGLLEPAVLSDTTNSMKVVCDEVFGPVVSIQRYRDFEDALALANDTRYGLQAGVFTADLSLALESGRRLDFGGVIVNEVPTWRADQMPYGGIRESGNTREGPAYSIEEMSERRLIVFSG
ncbi:MAG: Succinate-semialdehyde dehydrogenase [NADP(+)] GabD [Acidimicrobiales bacterium]|nr:Succinate-semialdehyde dehydrogenase [NADP(+)] GabD [Acidimicrobiales bacterium]